jgi:hypothetical protein
MFNTVKLWMMFSFIIVGHHITSNEEVRVKYSKTETKNLKAIPYTYHIDCIKSFWTLIVQERFIDNSIYKSFNYSEETVRIYSPILSDKKGGDLKSLNHCIN